MKKISLVAAAYKLVWLRITFFFLGPFVTTFLALTETMGGRDWNEMAPFLKARLFISCFMAGAISFVGFLDQSMGRAKDEVEARKNDHRAETARNPDPTPPTP